MTKASDESKETPVGDEMSKIVPVGKRVVPESQDTESAGSESHRCKNNRKSALIKKAHAED